MEKKFHVKNPRGMTFCLGTCEDFFYLIFPGRWIIPDKAPLEADKHE